jgi:FkbM family methyltransferase
MATLKQSAGALANRVLAPFSVELRSARRFPPATPLRPVGELVSVLTDMAARGFRPRTILDIGANRGHWTRAAMEAFPEARYVLFEPVAALEPLLRDVVGQAPGSRYVIAAVSAKEGTAELSCITYLDGTPTSGSTLFPSAPDPSLYRTTRVTVPSVTLDGLLARGEIPVPELVKIDVEGFELDVLSGARSLLGRTDAFILEVSFEAFWGQPIFHEVVAFMADAGYVVHDFMGFNRRPKDGTLGQADVCFVRKDSAMRRKGGWAD